MFNFDNGTGYISPLKRSLDQIQELEGGKPSCKKLRFEVSLNSLIKKLGNTLNSEYQTKANSFITLFNILWICCTEQNVEIKLDKLLEFFKCISDLFTKVDIEFLIELFTCQEEKIYFGKTGCQYDVVEKKLSEAFLAESNFLLSIDKPQINKNLSSLTKTLEGALIDIDPKEISNYLFIISNCSNYLQRSNYWKKIFHNELNNFMHSNNLSLEGCDFSDLDLSNLNFSNLNLTQINLENAILIGTKFCCTKLINANLSLANASKADFTNADMTGATLGIELINIDKQRLNCICMNETDFRGTNLTNVKWWGINFSGAITDDKTQFNFGKEQIIIHNRPNYIINGYDNILDFHVISIDSHNNNDTSNRLMLLILEHFFNQKIYINTDKLLLVLTKKSCYMEDPKIREIYLNFILLAMINYIQKFKKNFIKDSAPYGYMVAKLDDNGIPSMESFRISKDSRHFNYSLVIVNRIGKLFYLNSLSTNVELLEIEELNGNTDVDGIENYLNSICDERLIIKGLYSQFKLSMDDLIFKFLENINKYSFSLNQITGSDNIQNGDSTCFEQIVGFCGSSNYKYINDYEKILMGFIWKLLLPIFEMKALNNSANPANDLIGDTIDYIIKLLILFIIKDADKYKIFSKKSM
ncbi:MAG: pentapeptide repeat-containing protein [Neisseriaceae bacterium]